MIRSRKTKHHIKFKTTTKYQIPAPSTRGEVEVTRLKGRSGLPLSMWWQIKRGERGLGGLQRREW